jgi:YidC/Oxa1 family membrane protein insertase
MIMFLAQISSFWDLIQVPFGMLMGLLYNLTRNYGAALILFTVALKLVLLYPTMRSKRSMMKMSRLSPQIAFIQKKYENDRQKQAEATQALYKAEGVSMGGGCLWSLVPMLLLFPIYAVVRQPMYYMLDMGWDAINEICTGLGLADNNFYREMVAAGQSGLVNFSFFGNDLAATPQYNIFNSAVWAWHWAHIGLFLLPVLSAGSQILTMFISQKMNNSVVTNEKGVHDEKAAKEANKNSSTKTMMYIMPIMSLVIGFSMPAAMSLYWLAQGLIGTAIDVALTKHYRKIYDEEDASKFRAALEEEERQMEKERIRAERRAANPDGITQNTSKKKLQQNKQKEQEAAKAAAAKEYAEKKGISFEEAEKKAPLSGVESRPNCKGRAYRADRYSENTEE